MSLPAVFVILTFTDSRLTGRDGCNRHGIDSLCCLCSSGALNQPNLKPCLCERGSTCCVLLEGLRLPSARLGEGDVQLAACPTCFDCGPDLLRLWTSRTCPSSWHSSPLSDCRTTSLVSPPSEPTSATSSRKGATTAWP